MYAAGREEIAAGQPRVNAGAHSQGYLGVELHDVPDEQVASLHLQGSHGVEVVMVDHDGPAGKAGLQAHDVVVQVDGQGIENADDLRHRIRDAAPGKTMSFSILRLGHMLNLSAKLANREELERNSFHPLPPDTEEPGAPPERYTDSPAPPAPRSGVRGQSFMGSVLRSSRYTGLSLESMEPQLASFFGAPANTGLLVHGVDANSPASSAGMRAGDVVLRVDSVPVATPSDWTKRLKLGYGRPVSVTILRDKREQTVTLPPELKKHSLLEWPKIF